MLLLIPKLIPGLREWAHSNLYIKNLWLFGSYVRSEATEASDLDIAVEIEIPIERLGNETAFAVYVCEAKTWSGQLRHLLEFSDVQLEWLDLNDQTPAIKAGLTEGNLLIYSREPDWDSKCPLRCSPSNCTILSPG